MGSLSQCQYSDFRSEVVDSLPYFTPKQRVPVGTAILSPENGVTEESISPAFRSITIRGKTFQNRVWVAPMCMYSCKDGMFSDFHVAHYGQWALRGSALITLEATAVTATGRNTPQDAGLWSDDHIPPLKRIVDLIHSQSQKVAIQLQHAGRKSGVCPPWLGLRLVPDEFGGYGNDVQGPTEEPWNENYATPSAMSEEEILETVEAYGKAARRAVEAGVDVIAVHGAHGYLLHSFASPATNKRTDRWGACFENRTRIGVEVIRAIRRNIPNNMPVFWKISAVDWLPQGQGWELNDTLRYVPILAAEGVDLFDMSSGGTDRRQQVQLGQQYQVPFAKAVKDLKLPRVFVGAVGWIRDGDTVHNILSNGKADVVHVAREFLRDPNFVQRVALSTGTEVTWVDQYHRAPMNRKYVESTTTITTDAQAPRNVIQSHDNQIPNKLVS
ncbi:NADPH dehydrogenase [Fusarium albosuccineum]|uniref:NADPH dehydrogenase n=1 Tax=Fusarium albosuccineum TaxID=1237068 RepID=A0A8H4LDN0_9HYPO|nr:NADPH dehydrogenase [Fusarium albosuccineum]